MNQNNFNPSLVNHMSQLSHQNQPGLAQQPIQNLMANSGMDQARMWQQMQQMQQQSQHQQHLPMRQGGGDMGNGPNPAQLMEMFRNQNIARQQQQQQQSHIQQGLQHQLFGLQGQMGNPSQMHDQGAHVMQQPQLPAQLSAIQQAFAARQPAIARQFDMLTQSQQQQQQPGAANFALRHYQQQQQQAQLQQALQQQQQQMRQQGMMAGLQGQQAGQGAPGNFFAGGQNMGPMADGGPQRFPGAVLANPQAGPQAPNPVQNTQQNRTLTLQNLRAHFPVVQSQIVDAERQLALIQSSVMAHKSEGERHSESERLIKEIEGKKELLKKMHTMISTLVSDAQAAQQQQQQPKPPGQAQQPNGWMPQPAPSPANANVPPTLTGPQIPSQPQQHGNQPSVAPQLPGQNRNLLPQPTPGAQNMTHVQPPPHGSPANAPQVTVNVPGRNPAQPLLNPQQMNRLTVLQRTGGFPALPLPAFESAFKEWCNKQGIHVNPQILTLEDGKQISLHKLHAEVIAAGTIAQLGENPENWAVIGGRMGLGPGGNPQQKCSQPIALRLLQIYRDYLQQFDLMYLKSSLQKKLQSNPISQQADANSSNPPTGPSNPPGPQQQDGLHASLQGLFNTADPQRISQLMSYSRLTSDQLRSMGVSQDIINTIEINRPLLARQLSAQAQFREGVKTANQVNSMNNIAAFQQQQQQQNMLANQANMRAGMPQTPANAVAGPSGVQQMQPQNGHMPGNLMQNRAMNPAIRQSPEEAQQKAQLAAQRLRQEVRAHRTGNLPNAVNIPEHLRSEYNAHFEQLVRSASELDQKLPLVIMLFAEHLPRKMVEIITMVQIQRQFLASPNPRYIIDGPNLRQMAATTNAVLDALAKKMQMQRAGQQGQPAQPQYPGPPPHAQLVQSHHQQHIQPQASSPPNAAMQPSAPTSMGIPTGLMQPPPHPPMPPPHVPTPQPQPSPRLHPTPVLAAAKKKQTGPENVASPAAASTPAASASTPTHLNSPSTPKSPKTKPKPKPVPKRKPSVAKAPPPVAGPSTAPAPASTPSTSAPVSASTPVSAATPSGMDQSSPAAATPESVGTKRRREEEVSPVAVGPVDAPSPKKARTDWDGPANADLAKKKEEVDALQSDEDAVKFFENVKDLLNMTSDDESAAEIANVINGIISGYNDPLSNDGGFGALGDVGTSDPSAGNASLGDGLEFFDFNSYSSAFDDDTGSKAVTPDLLQTTSTNPSPRSGSETDHVQASNVPDTATIVEPKAHDGAVMIDPLRLGIWKEVDGAGSYHSSGDGWKWDGHMSSSDLPWAIVSQP